MARRRTQRVLRTVQEIADEYQIDLDRITPDTPLRLELAAALAYPDGSMTLRALRQEKKSGRLIVESIANKDYTTLANIKLMRERARYAAPAAPSAVNSALPELMRSMTAEQAQAFALTLARRASVKPEPLSGGFPKRVGVELPDGFEAFRTYKGKEFRAKVVNGGWLCLNDGRTYSSLNKLSLATFGHTDSVWRQWYYRDRSGLKRPLHALRVERS